MIDENIKKIADHYGEESQLDILQEECAELIQAVSKYKRAQNYPDFDGYYAFSNLVEEIVDVEIMLEQIKYFLDCPKVYSDWRNKKISRQLMRIENEKGDEADGSLCNKT